MPCLQAGCLAPRRRLSTQAGAACSASRRSPPCSAAALASSRLSRRACSLRRLGSPPPGSRPCQVGPALARACCRASPCSTAHVCSVSLAACRQSHTESAAMPPHCLDCTLIPLCSSGLFPWPPCSREARPLDLRGRHTPGVRHSLRAAGVATNPYGVMPQPVQVSAQEGLRTGLAARPMGSVPARTQLRTPAIFSPRLLPSSVASRARVQSITRPAPTVRWPPQSAQLTAGVCSASVEARSLHAQALQHVCSHPEQRQVQHRPRRGASSMAITQTAGVCSHSELRRARQPSPAPSGGLSAACMPCPHRGWPASEVSEPTLAAPVTGGADRAAHAGCAQPQGWPRWASRSATVCCQPTVQCVQATLGLRVGHAGLPAEPQRPAGRPDALLAQPGHHRVRQPAQLLRA